MNEPKRHAIAADNVFDGWTRHKDASVLIEGSLVVGVVPQSELPTDLEIRKLPSEVWLVPGFIDIQVNGGGDVLFNNAPTPEAILAIAAAHRKYGTTAVLPTFITDTSERMAAAFSAVQSLVGCEPSVLGIHLEGPFLSPEKAGVHDASLMHQPGPADLEMICGTRKGVLLMTLAPERVPNGFIDHLAQSGARVSLGHSMATYEETLAAMAEGLSGFTHLFNAMRPLASREPGPIAAALESPNAWFGMIVDGFHVNPAMLRLALRGLARSILVTDAMPPVGGRQSKFDLYGAEIHVIGGRCARPDGTLAGSALNMAAAVRNCVQMLDVSLEDALRFASRNPAEFMGLGHRLGGLRPGYRADVVALNSDTFDVLGTWVAGKEQRDVVAADRFSPLPSKPKRGHNCVKKT
jgi:N-acetylglucosamine-6-phosphate deacetylase